MDYPEFRRHLGKAGITLNDYAALLHVRPNSMSNYAKKGFVPQQHAIIAVAMGDSGDRGTNFGELMARYGVYPQTPAGNVTLLETYRKNSQRRARGK